MYKRNLLLSLCKSHTNFLPSGMKKEKVKMHTLFKELPMAGCRGSGIL